MADLMEHDGYRASLSYDAEQETFYGVVVNVTAHIDFYASS